MAVLQTRQLKLIQNNPRRFSDGVNFDWASIVIMVVSKGN
jgi:hypothetical protein